MFKTFFFLFSLSLRLERDLAFLCFCQICWCLKCSNWYLKTYQKEDRKFFSHVCHFLHRVVFFYLPTLEACSVKREIFAFALNTWADSACHFSWWKFNSFFFSFRWRILFFFTSMGGIWRRWYAVVAFLRFLFFPLKKFYVLICVHDTVDKAWRRRVTEGKSMSN